MKTGSVGASVVVLCCPRSRGNIRYRSTVHIARCAGTRYVSRVSRRNGLVTAGVALVLGVLAFHVRRLCSIFQIFAVFFAPKILEHSDINCDDVGVSPQN